MKYSLLQLCFVLGVASAIGYEYGDFDAKDMAALGNRLSNDPYMQFSDVDLRLINSAIDCYNQMGYILDLPELD